MTVYALIPVHNRLHFTREVIRCLRDQTFSDLRIVVVDDGSSDGTAEFLAEQQDVTVFHGDGNLWWAGAIHLAMKELMPVVGDDDCFLFVNNDTTFEPNYVETLISSSHNHPDAVIGSVLRDAEPPHALLSIGPICDFWRMGGYEKLNAVTRKDKLNPLEVFEVDALPGRGTLYPIRIVRKIGLMRPWLLSHYYADYEYAARAKRIGLRNLVASEAAVFLG